MLSYRERYKENSANNALDALAKMSQANTKVVRDGKEITIPSIEVVKGDIVLIITGDIVPADMRLIEAVDLKVSVEVHNSYLNDCLFRLFFKK